MTNSWSWNFISGEHAKVAAFTSDQGLTINLVLVLFLSAIFAFCLNIASFSASRCSTPLTMTVAGNVKQVLTILLGVFLFNTRVGFTNAVGVIVTLSGTALYSKVQYAEKMAKAEEAALDRAPHKIMHGAGS